MRRRKAREKDSAEGAKLRFICVRLWTILCCRLKKQLAVKLYTERTISHLGRSVLYSSFGLPASPKEIPGSLDVELRPEGRGGKGTCVPSRFYHLLGK